MAMAHNELFANRVTRSVPGHTKPSQARAVQKDLVSYFIIRTE